MSRKKNCRRTPEEQAIHKEAVRLRGMTDKQLVEQFHRAAEPKKPALGAQAAHSGGGVAEAGTNTSAVEALISGLSAGKCKGIKGATVYKITEFAKEMGLLA